MKTSMLICLATAISVQAQTFTDFPCPVDSKRVVIIGGGAAAVAAAETAQTNGWQTIIVDPRNHIAGMMAASNHTWLLNGSTGESVPRPEGTIKKELFARVMDAGAYPLLLSHCAGLLVMGNRIQGVAIASKFGTFILQAEAVIDASEEQIAAKHLLGLPPKWTQTAEINFELNKAHGFTSNKLDLPDGVVTAHRTIKDGVLCISAHKSMECNASDWLAASRLEIEMRQWAVQLTAQIRKHVINMQDVQLNRFGELRIITQERELPAMEGLLRIPSQLPLEATTQDLRKLEAAAAKLADDFCKQWKPAAAENQPKLLSLGKELAFSPSTSSDTSKLLQPIAVTPTESTDIDVLVAGGGTGGSAVMTALAQHKTPALTVDILPFLGGTTTGGGVSGAWHGYQQGAYATYCKNRDQLGRDEHLSRFCASVRLWDKMLLSQETKQQFLGQAVVCGATQQDHKITSVLVYSANGFRSVSAKLTIDATGDADLCAQAGVKTEFGDENGWIQSSSCWGIDDWSTGSNFQQNHYGNDFDVVDPTDYADTIRGLMLAHRRNGDYHLAPIYTQRESRRIIGNYYLTLNNILTRKFRTDAIAVASCLFDSHGRLTSELIKRYLTADAYHADKEIHVLLPFGTFVPKGMANLLVAAKAISGERDATSLCRMNPDITNAGYAVGTAASQFIERNLAKTVDIDLDRIRMEMKEIGVLPDWAFTPPEPEWTVDFAAKRLDSPGGHLPALFMPPEQIIPVLKKRLADGAPEPDQTAMLLAWFGCTDGQARLIRKFNIHAKQDMAKFEDKGPDGFIVTDVNGKTYEGNERTNYGFPQFGKFLPGRAYGVLNRMIVTLSHIDTPETLELVLPLLERAWAGSDTLRLGTTPYAIARRDSAVTYFHERLWALAVFFRNRPTPRAIPALERLLQQKYVGGNIMHEPWGENPYFQMTYLEIMLADALHRCGGELGTRRLQDFSTDSRAIFRNMAIRCLNTKKEK